MDGPRFDALAKSLSAAGPRRRLLAGLLGAALAAPLGRAGAQACKRDGKPCKKHSQCCSGNCVGASGGPANDGTCQPAVHPCAGADYCFSYPGSCGTSAFCSCATTQGGAAFCAFGGVSCQPCTDASGCPAGKVCIQAACCDEDNPGVTTGCVSADSRC